MNTNHMPAVRSIDLVQEQRMTQKLEKIALTLLCAGMAAIAVTAFTAVDALAAEPGATPNMARQGPGLPMVALSPAAPGMLTGVAAAGTVDMNTTLTFNFKGTGPCKLALNSGDGSVADFNGTLPFTATHFYSSGTMTSFEAFKDYTATVTPSGNCKISGPGPFTATVRVVNPHPQSAGTPPKDNTVTLAGTGKLTLGVKPIDGAVLPGSAASRPRP